MAEITLLHWNLQQFSNNKLNDDNGQALIDYIAAVVARSRANIVSLIELKNSAVDSIVSKLVPAINLANGVHPKLNKWSAIKMDSQKNHEAYVALYQLGNGFVVLPPAIGVTSPINDLTNQLLRKGSPGGILFFNSSKTKRGGRKPYYVTFRTTDTKKNFSVLAYHTMYGIHSGQGVRSIGEIAQSRAILLAGVTTNMDASLTSGDFNVDFTEFPFDYKNLLSEVPSKQSTDEKTSLKSTTPPDGYPTSEGYRSNAYDNIFKYNRTTTPSAGGGVVTDLIYDSTVKDKGSGRLAKHAGAFKRGPIQAGILIQNIPPKDFEDSWHIVRHAISDHLPVYVTVTI